MLEQVETRCFISIHAPRTGSDLQRRAEIADVVVFQSTLPARGATRVACIRQHAVDISIHAPRTGSDAKSIILCYNTSISIHAPRTGSDLENSSDKGS